MPLKRAPSEVTLMEPEVTLAGQQTIAQKAPAGLHASALDKVPAVRNQNIFK